MKINEMKLYLARYGKLQHRASRITREIASHPSEAKFLTPLLSEINAKCADILGLVLKIENTEKRELIYRKYICSETLAELGETMGYTPRHISRLINLAIASMNEVDEDE